MGPSRIREDTRQLRAARPTVTGNGVVSAAAYGKPSRVRAARWRDAGLGYALSLPALLWILTITLYPIVYNLWLSVHETGPLLQAPTFAGLRHYSAILKEAEFWKSLERTVIWTVGSLSATLLPGLGLALLLNQDFPGARLIRTWILLPWMFPIVVVAMIWVWLLEPTVGVANYALRIAGLTSQPVVFLSVDWAMVTVILTNAWRWIPFVAVNVLAALMNVPRELEDAAKVDGAGYWQRFRFVALPEILPAIGVLSLVLLMWFFNMFPLIWLITRGGPADATTILPVAIYKTGFELFLWGPSAALGVILFLFVAAMTGVYLTIIARYRIGAGGQW